MRHHRILAALAGAALVSAPAGQYAAGRAVPDVRLVQGAICTAAAAGPPVLLARLVRAQTETRPFQPGQQLPAPADTSPPPLYGNLGRLHMAVTTNSRGAQAYFDQGLRLAFAFNHAEAARAFRAAQRLDPHCAMCHWGEALVLGPNINAPMFPDAVAPAHAAAARAQLLAGRAGPQERALIRAIVQRYADAPLEDRSALDRAYADAMMEAAHAFPADDHIQVLYAESLMDLSPWDYWERGGARPKGRSGEMVATLERVLARNPTHAGAAHYYIHAVEASSAPERALPAARVLARQIPGAGHIVHMPAHIYYRLGMVRELLAVNLDAVATDERYFRGARSDPVYKGAYYPHNIHFVMVSALMGGDGQAALAASAKLDKVLPHALVAQFPLIQPVKSAVYFSHVQFSSPDTLLALPDPGPDLVLVRAMWHYARAVGFARKHMVDESRDEIGALAALERDADFRPFDAWHVPARAIVATARNVATGRLADARGDAAAALTAYRAAVETQDRLPYMEPPYWYYPARQSLGVALLRAGRVDDAEDVFRAALARTPSNGWALRGLMEVYRRRGDEASLKQAQERFAKTWLGKDGMPPLAAL
ncbi:lipopolysaccharide assembly protein LapB [uncultured Massilia sp.]|uniref:tetratricopeptide repeat protein n=1 Tax=uncultured Massilia sp. TaxID=169973 RepID=UPI0025DDD712|nr:tetratricopeptide repeat protein [uncultured Massilia sp.]